jgi:hypothetical protein
MHLILQAKILRAIPGHEQEALAIAVKAVETHNPPSDAWRTAGLLSFELGHYEAAEGYYRHITDLIEQGSRLSQDVYRDLGDVRLRRGNLAGALQAYDAYLAVPQYQHDGLSQDVEPSQPGNMTGVYDLSSAAYSTSDTPTTQYDEFDVGMELYGTPQYQHHGHYRNFRAFLDK